MPNSPIIMAPQFFDLEAAADFLGNGAIEVPEFQAEILDLVRRRGVFGQRLNYVPATGQPTRYFEQTAIALGAFTDPRNISPSATSPTRIENSVTLRAVTGQINFSLFDVEVTQQQAMFAMLVAKDLHDLVEGTLQVEDKALWNGNNGLSAVTFNGVLNTSGITTGSIAPGASIVDSIRSQVAQMVNNQTYVVKPTAIYYSPVAGNYLEQEIKTNSYYVAGTQEVVAGVDVTTIRTQAGILPLIPAWEMPQLTGGPTGAQYPIVIMTENLMEYHYVTSQNPRVFQLGLISDLASKFVTIKFGTLVVKGASYAHAVLNLQR